VLNIEGVFSSRMAEDLRCYFVKKSAMHTRRSVLVGVSSALVLAGCMENDSEATTEEDTDSEATEESLAISNAQLNNIPLDQYDVDFPADVTPEQLADEFQHQLEYETQRANGPVESTINVEYTDPTIPTEDEGPLNEQIEADVYETGDITQDIQFPDHLVEHLIENPRNIQATLQAEDTETGQTTDREFTLNYADMVAENVYKEAFEQDDLAISDAELVQINVNEGLINLEYDSDENIGTDEFNQELPTGIYQSVVTESRVPYKLEYTVNDGSNEEYHVSVEEDFAIEHLNGETSAHEFRNKVHFNHVRSE